MIMYRLLFALMISGVLSCAQPIKQQQYTQVRQSSLLPNHTRVQHEAVSRDVMITSQGRYTTQAAVRMLEQGGNLFDAAAAMSFVIAVERPHSTGIGGGGFMLVHDAKRQQSQAYDFRETAPLAAHQAMYVAKDGRVDSMASRIGGLAVATPGLVRGVLAIHKKHGKLTRAQILQPAIELAQQGFAIYPALALAIDYLQTPLKQYGGENIFFHPSGRPLQTGELLQQSALAKTLTRIAKQGDSGFYQGETAAAIVAAINRTGGVITQQDLARYQMKARQPVSGEFRGYRVLSMPPPSSGGVHIIQMLNTLEHFDLASLGAQHPYTINTVVSAMQVAYADRARYLGDDDFTQVPLKSLTSKAYAKQIAAILHPEKRLSAGLLNTPQKLPYESDQTTHFTLMDKRGNVISSTQTINGWFGSGVVVNGIVLNNEMDDFAAQLGASNLYGAIGGKNNLVQPLKRPLSSMSPTLVFKSDGAPFLALGTPSGTRIINCVMQTILNRIEFGMPLYEAVHATRYHHQWQPDEIRIGAPYFIDETMHTLQQLGYRINKKDLGCKVQAIEKTATQLIGVSDNRGEGLALGWD